MEQQTQNSWVDKFFTKFPIEYWGLSGSVFVTLGCLISGFMFKTAVDQPYSILLFFISELGGVGISQAAWAFNLGLILAGIPFTLFMIGLAYEMKSKIIGIGLGLGGVYAAVNCLLVGVFPYNIYMAEHKFTALSFFYTGMILVFLYSIIFLFNKNKPFPRWTGIFGLIVAAIFAGFLFAPLDVDGFMLTNDELRVGISWLAFFEWLVLFGILSWIITLSVLHFKMNRK